MEASISIQPRYAIGVVLDDSLKAGDVTKTANKFSDLFNLITVKDENLNYVVLKDIVPETLIHFYIGIGRSVPKQIKDKVQAAVNGGVYLPNSRLMWFDGQDYSKEQITTWMRKLASQDDCKKIWIVDLNTVLTGDLLTKFEDI